MSSRYFKIFFLFISFILPGVVKIFAQSYPVHISNHLTPPYSGYLPDYAEPGSEKLKVIIQLNDFSIAQYQVKLKFEIKGNGFTLSTKTFYNPAPIILHPGQPLLLSDADLAQYLSSNNLDFIGINQSQYEQKKVLPEGYYSICVTAYDYYSTPLTQVSNEGCSQAWFTLSDPPFLNVPICNSVVPPVSPQNIIFQWTPMNLGSPNSAFNTEYDFFLWECRPDTNANPNQLVLSTAPIYSTTTQQTLINYGISEPALNLYMKYVWKVRARDISGRDVFKNNGFSQICTFKYGSIQNTVGNSVLLVLNAEALSHRTGRCYWNMESIFNNYLLQVRKQGTTEWFNYSTNLSSQNIENLEPETTYEARVQGTGNGLTTDWSDIANFTTQAAPVFACNNQAMPYNTALPKPLDPVKAVNGLIIQSGQFEVKVSQIFSTGYNGWYAGKGYVSLLGLKKVPVKWSNIFIDSAAHHQQGVIQAETSGINNWVHQWDIDQAQENATYVDGGIDTIYISNGQVCYVVQGNQNVICVPTPTGVNVMVVRDGEGNEYDVTLSPPPAKITGPVNYLHYSSDSLAADENKIVSFEENANQAYGFDNKVYAGFIDNYEVIKLRNGSNYFVSNKSVGEGGFDVVIAKLPLGHFNSSLLKFKSAAGDLLAFSSLPFNKVLVSGVSHSFQSIYAWYGTEKIGKLNIVSLPQESRKVVIVPINNTSIPGGLTGIASALNSTYKQANVTWSVNAVSSFSFGLGDGVVDAADATLLSKYSSEMRALRDAYKQYDSLYDKNAYYLFVVPAFSDQNIQGYMVRGRAVGFISGSASSKEIAHELGHGAFALEHSFPKVEKSTSDNLMDYSTETTMVKGQWLYASTTPVYSWTDDEEDAAYIGKYNTAAGAYYWINKIKLAYKNNVQVTIPARTDLIGRSDNCYLAGIQYDSICVYSQFQYNSFNADVKNKIMIGVVNRVTSNGIIADSCLRIDGGKIIIRVPYRRLNVMKIYLENQNTFKNLILFVNGYRPVVNGDGDEVIGLKEYVNSNNQVEFGDSRGYWKGIDAQFINRIGIRQAIYADGHHSVETSNHQSVLKFSQAFAVALATQEECLQFPTTSKCNSKAWETFLHRDPNAAGFLQRVENGSKAGKDLLQKINNGEIVFNKLTDEVDIVAHSMGYAYSLGMISELSHANIKFGRYYIIAPENPACGGLNWSSFKEVWQYGANLGEQDEDWPWLQDGVAPQRDVPNIRSAYANTKNGRITIPSTGVAKGFLESHSIKNYGWIFNIVNGDPKGGYVKPRN